MWSGWADERGGRLGCWAAAGQRQQGFWLAGSCPHPLPHLQPCRYLPVLLFFYFSFWWPQIVLCIRCDARQPLKPEFILGSSAARLALPLYIFGCPSNLLSAAPNPVLCAGLVAWVGLQCALLLLQYYYGPRCCIPTLVSTHVVLDVCWGRL